jgi:drug/metabolite transporter (DMT)-like permease
MRVIAAYLGVILLWSTTPLAIKWSGEGPGYLFGVAARMSIGLLGVLLVMTITRTPLRRDRKALWTYVAGALQIYGAMLATYWASQHIPSGWISVVFGLTPLLTAPLAAAFLGEKSLTIARIASYLLGLAGLVLMFHSALNFSPAAVLGIGAVLLAALLQAISSVWVKRVHANVPAFALVTGSLLIAVPAHWLTWAMVDGVWPSSIPPVSLLSIAYLGVVATTFGFTMYFYVLRHLSAGKVALITLIVPPMSLYLGFLVNHEALHESVIGGTALIMAALLLDRSSDFRWRRNPNPPH